jgi:hypothetical protein
MDVIMLIGLGVLGLAGTVTPAVLTHRKQSRQLGEIREQVSNDHDSNLRDDIDDLRNLLREGFRETRLDINGLREELRTERIERIEGDRLRVVGGS